VRRPYRCIDGPARRHGVAPVMPGHQWWSGHTEKLRPVVQLLAGAVPVLAEQLQPVPTHPQGVPRRRLMAEVGRSHEATVGGGEPPHPKLCHTIDVQALGQVLQSDLERRSRQYRGRGQGPCAADQRPGAALHSRCPTISTTVIMHMTALQALMTAARLSR